MPKARAGVHLAGVAKLPQFGAAIWPALKTGVVLENRILGLDGIRAVAVLMVFAQHTNNLAQSLQAGDFGVWAFFVLSGFLIVRILHAQRLDIEVGRETIASAWLKFFRRRTLRIFPIYYLVLSICAVLTLTGPLLHYSGGQWPYYWSYLTNVYIETTGLLPGIFTHLWSLAVEEQFYLFAAPVFLLLPSRLAPHLCVLVIAVGLARGFLNSESALHYDSLFNFYMLALGGLAGLIVSRIEPRTAKIVFSIAAPVMALALAADYATTRTLKHSVFLFPLFVSSLYIFIFHFQKTLLVRALDCVPLRNLGRISYGFYLYHNFVKLDAIRSALGISFEPPNKVRVALELLITIVVATLSWVTIERPLLKRKPELRAINEPSKVNYPVP